MTLNVLGRELGAIAFCLGFSEVVDELEEGNLSLTVGFSPVEVVLTSLGELIFEVNPEGVVGTFFTVVVI